MKALVTGATGFMGSKLCQALSKRGDQVRALVFPGEDYTHIKDYIVETREGDITKPETLKGVAEGMDVVYHLAARVVDYGSHDDFYRPILDGTRNMLAASADGVGRFVFVSSFCACGTGRHLKGMKESDPCVKTGVFYGDAKLLAEEEVRKYKGRFKNGFVIARPSNVTGPRSVWVTEVGTIIRDGIFAYFDGGRHSASLVYIDNLIEGLVLCGTKPEAADQTYFFRDDFDITWKRYLDDLASMFGRKLWLNLPFGLAWFLGGLAERLARIFKRRPPITLQSAGLMGRNCDVDTTKARTELGWKTSVTYEEAIKEIEIWVKGNMI